MIKSWLGKKALQFIESHAGSKQFYSIANKLFRLPTPTKHPLFFAQQQATWWQGHINKTIIPNNQTQIWPFWLQEQLNDQRPLYSPFTQTIHNHHQRKWTALSAPNQDQTPSVDPKGLLTCALHSWSIDHWIKLDNTLYSPATIQNTQQTFSNNPPCVTTKFKLKQLNIKITSFLKAGHPGQAPIFNQISITNHDKDPQSLSCFIAIRPYNTEGIAPIQSIQYLSNHVFMVNQQLGLILDQPPHNIICSNMENGDISNHYDQWQMILNSECPNHFCSALAEFKLDIAPKDTQSISSKCIIPTQTLQYSTLKKALKKKKKRHLNNQINELQLLKFDQEKSYVTYQKQQEHPNKSFLFSCQNSTITTLFNQSISHLENACSPLPPKLSQTHLSIHGYLNQIQALNLIGNTQLAERQLKQLSTHSFNSILSLKRSHTLAELAHIISCIHHHFTFQQNKGTLEHFQPMIDAIINLIEKSCQKPNPLYPSINGLLPPSFSSHFLDHKDCFIWDQFYAFAACKAAINIYKQLDMSIKINPLISLSQRINRAIESTCSHVSKTQSGPLLFPISPSAYKDPRIIRSLVGVYPLGVLSAKTPKVLASLEWLEAHHTQDGILQFLSNPLGFSTIDNGLLGIIYCLQQSPKLFPTLSWLIKTASPTGTWPTSIYPINGNGCDGNGHEIESNINFISIIRHMLIQDQGQDCQLLPMIPTEWLNENHPIQIQNLPTQFGPLSLSLSIQNNKATLAFKHQFHRMPKQLSIRSPKRIKAELIDGKLKPIKSHTLFIDPNRSQIEFIIDESTP